MMIHIERKFFYVFCRENSFGKFRKLMNKFFIPRFRSVQRNPFPAVLFLIEMNENKFILKTGIKFHFSYFLFRQSLIQNRRFLLRYCNIVSTASQSIFIELKWINFRPFSEIIH